VRERKRCLETEDFSRVEVQASKPERKKIAVRMGFARLMHTHVSTVKLRRSSSMLLSKGG